MKASVEVDGDDVAAAVAIGGERDVGAVGRACTRAAHPNRGATRPDVQARTRGVDRPCPGP